MQIEIRELDEKNRRFVAFKRWFWLLCAGREYERSLLRSSWFMIRRDQFISLIIRFLSQGNYAVAVAVALPFNCHPFIIFTPSHRVPCALNLMRINDTIKFSIEFDRPRERFSRDCCAICFRDLDSYDLLQVSFPIGCCCCHKKKKTDECDILVKNKLQSHCNRRMHL